MVELSAEEKKAKVPSWRFGSRYGFYETVPLLYWIEDEKRFWKSVSFPDKVWEKKIEEIRIENPQLSDKELKRKAEAELKRILKNAPFYFEPQVRNVEIALKCGLIPFIYDDYFFFLVAEEVPVERARLDAYQALTSGTIDEASELFYNEEHFREVVGDKVTEEVKRNLGLRS